MIQWKHLQGCYLSRCFRIFREDGAWWLCDIRGGTLQSPAWKFKTAKEARVAAERMIRFHSQTTLRDREAMTTAEQTDTDDNTLMEFVAMFAGSSIPISDYLGSLDAWHRDIWPIIASDGVLGRNWYPALAGVLNSCQLWDLANADARSRCLALYRALDGKLPGCKK